MHRLKYLTFRGLHQSVPYSVFSVYLMQYILWRLIDNGPNCIQRDILQRFVRWIHNLRSFCNNNNKKTQTLVVLKFFYSYHFVMVINQINFCTNVLQILNTWWQNYLKIILFMEWYPMHMPFHSHVHIKEHGKIGSYNKTQPKVFRSYIL